jgi:hypothetical protein
MRGTSVANLRHVADCKCPRTPLRSFCHGTQGETEPKVDRKAHHQAEILSRTWEFTVRQPGNIRGRPRTMFKRTTCDVWQADQSSTRQPRHNRLTSSWIGERLRGARADVEIGVMRRVKTTCSRKRTCVCREFAALHESIIATIQDVACVPRIPSVSPLGPFFGTKSMAGHHDPDVSINTSAGALSHANHKVLRVSRAGHDVRPDRAASAGAFKRGFSSSKG